MSKLSRWYSRRGSFLRISAQTYALLEMVQGKEVLLPEVIKGIEHKEIVSMARRSVSPNSFSLASYWAFAALKNKVEKSFPCQVPDIDGIKAEMKEENLVDFALQGLDVPILRGRSFSGAKLDGRGPSHISSTSSMRRSLESAAFMISRLMP